MSLLCLLPCKQKKNTTIMFDTMHTTIGKKEAVSSTGMSKQKKTVTLLCLLPCIQQVLQLAMDRSMFDSSLFIEYRLMLEYVDKQVYIE